MTDEQKAFIWKFGVRGWGVPMFFIFFVTGVVVPAFYGAPITAWRVIFSTLGSAVVTFPCAWLFGLWLWYSPKRSVSKQ